MQKRGLNMGDLYNLTGRLAAILVAVVIVGGFIVRAIKKDDKKDGEDK